jgi:AcrR family transcriptional regulator
VADETVLPPLSWSGLHRRDAEETSGGLRERKKRMTRQQISDTATMMFLERGFDEVRVSEVAATCGVSEKTVFNYFPTKESLLLDQEDASAAAIRRALGPDGPAVSPVEAVVDLLDGDARELDTGIAELAATRPAGPYLDVIRRFIELVEGTPSLRAAQMDMNERLARVAAEAMAARAGVNPEDPEPQIAASALLGLWRVFYQSVRRHAEAEHPAASVRNGVMGDVRRAARLIDTGLWSFGTVVQGTSGRDQLDLAAAASVEARRQVMIAIKQARTAWRLVKADGLDRRRDPSFGRPQADGRRRPDAATHHAMLEAWEAARNSAQAAQEAKRMTQEAKRMTQKAVREANQVHRRPRP